MIPWKYDNAKHQLCSILSMRDNNIFDSLDGLNLL